MKLRLRFGQLAEKIERGPTIVVGRRILGACRERSIVSLERFVKAATTFNPQQTGAVLNAVPVPAGAGDLRAKLLAASAGGAGPDVMLHNALEVSSYLGTGLLYDLDTALKSNKEWAQRKQQLTPTTLAGHTWQGKLVTFPAETSAIAVFYNGITVGGEPLVTSATSGFGRSKRSNPTSPGEMPRTSNTSKRGTAEPRRRGAGACPATE